MTGMIEGYQPLGRYLTRQTGSGYDLRTPNGLVGAVSLVRPRLLYDYLRSSDPNDPIISTSQTVRMWTMKVNFLPEPGEMLLLGAGIATLVGLARLRRR